MFLLKRALFLHASMFITFLHGKEITYYSSFNWENNVKLGAESSISDFIYLANDPRSSLPDSFTVCSSLLVNFVNQKIHFLEMYKVELQTKVPEYYAKAPARAFSWLKAPTSAFTFNNTLLRNYAKWILLSLKWMWLVLCRRPTWLLWYLHPIFGNLRCSSSTRRTGHTGSAWPWRCPTAWPWWSGSTMKTL